MNAKQVTDAAEAYVQREYRYRRLISPEFISDAMTRRVAFLLKAWEEESRRRTYTVNCESGPYGMSANVTTHAAEHATIPFTLCGKLVSKTGRWAAIKERSVREVDCKRCFNIIFARVAGRSVVARGRTARANKSGLIP